jgi:AcrR family transcriptional regulator
MIAGHHIGVQSERQNHAEICDRILSAAEGLLHKHGYQRVAVADLARHLEMSPANIYRFFASKQSIWNALAERLVTPIEQDCARLSHGNGSASDRLANLIVEYHRLTAVLYLSSPKVREFLDIAIQERWKFVDRHAETMRRLIWELILDGTHNGEFQVVNVDGAARIAYHAIVTFIGPVPNDPPGTDKDFKHAREIGHFVLGALQSGCL